MQVKNTLIKLVVAAAAMFPFAVSAQTSSINAFSPYTMYGIGEQNTPGTLSMRSMGGAGVAMRSPGTLNLLNPAAYSAAQQKTFLFNFGLEGQNYYNSQKVAGESKNTAYNTFNFHDIAFQMPLARKLGLGFSLTPYSSVGYRTKYYHEYDPTDPVYGNVGNVQYNYQGEGDVTEVKLGIGWEVFKNFSIGVAAQYYWGDIDRTFVMTPTAITGEGYWAVTKQFYTMMQYSKYLKAGYTMIDIADGNMCAAVSPDGDEIVIVAQNFGNDRTTTVDLSDLNGPATAEVYQTSDAKSCEKVETQDVTDGVLDITLPKNSVTTYVIQAEDGSALCSMENYANIVGADVVKPEEDWTSDRNKFTYEGSWGESADEFGGGKYTTSAGTSVTFTFEGEQAAIYGTKGSEAGKVLVSVDGGEAKEVDLSGNGKDGDALIYYTGKLENAKHTVMISKAEGHEEKLLEINHAKVIHGEFIEQAEGVESSGTVFTVSGVRPILPDKVKVVSNQGNITEKAVVWDVEGQDFTSDVKLTGSVEGTDKKGTVDVKIVPEHMAYYIDCNSPKSPAYASVDAYADLLNEVPDQAYEKDAWGYVETYGAHDTDESNLKDAYETGWWAKEGQSIQYTIPLEKGSYKVEFGFKEWWKDYNSSRPMKVSMVQGETKTELGTTNTWNGGKMEYSL